MYLIRYIKEVWSALRSLWTGLRTTFYYFSHHKEIITQEYPDNRHSLVLPERFKGEVVMPHNEINEHRCTGCTACELACPNGTIKVITKFDITREGKKKKAIDLTNGLDNVSQGHVFRNKLKPRSDNQKEYIRDRKSTRLNSSHRT